MPSPANLVQEISTSNGLGDFTLVAVDGRQTFDQAFGIGGLDAFDYFITSRDNGEWEVGTGHLLNATTLVRDTVLESSNSNNPVNFSAGTTDVTNDINAINQARLDGDQVWTGANDFSEGIVVGGVAAEIDSDDVRFKDINLQIGNVASPTDVTADGGGITLLGDTNKTIIWDDTSGRWTILPSLQVPTLDVTSNSGTWDSSGINIGALSSYLVNGTLVIEDNAGALTLRNIDAIDAVTRATIQAALIHGVVDTVDDLIAGQLLLGDGGDFIVTESALTYDGTTFNVDGDINIEAGQGLNMNGVIILSEDTGVRLNNISQVDTATITTFEGEITALESNLLTLNNVGTPTDANANQGGLKVRGTTDKTILWDQARDQWLADTAIAAPFVEADTQFTAPSGSWDSAGIKLDQSAILSVDARTVILEFSGNIGLNNIDVIDATTATTIEAAVVPDVVPQAEAEAGTATTERIWTAERVSQSIAALAGGGSDPTFVGPITIATGSPTSVILASGIPAGTREIILAFDGISHDADNNGWIVQIGDSGGLETSGYIGGGWTDVDPSTNDNGFRWAESGSIDAGTTVVAEFTLQHVGGNQWTFSGTAFPDGPNSGDYLSGVGLKTLTGELTQIALTTISGTPTIDGGLVRVRYL